MSNPVLRDEAILVIADIIQNQLELEDEQVMLANQKIDISKLPDLYVDLQYVSAKAIGVSNITEPTEDGMNQIQQVVMHYLIQIDVMSYDAAARTRKEEIILALRSPYAEQAQGLNNMQIARIPESFVNASTLEATAMLNRFTMTVPVTALVTKTKVIEYYDTFQAKVYTDPNEFKNENKGAGIAIDVTTAPTGG